VTQTRDCPFFLYGGPAAWPDLSAGAKICNPFIPPLARLIHRWRPKYQ